MKGDLLRVYADTSVFGGIEDAEFLSGSTGFFEAVRGGAIILVLSRVVERELQDAPGAIRRLLEEMLSVGAERVEVTAEAILLQQAYLDAEILTGKSETDALHVAVASVMRCSAIVSWNFKHIVNLRRIPLYNAVNRLQGYDPIEIRSPLEVIEYEDDG